MQSLPAPGGECPAIVSVWGEGRRDYNGAGTQSGDGPQIFGVKGHIKTVVAYGLIVKPCPQNFIPKTPWPNPNPV